MAQLDKQQLKLENNASFPDNDINFITPAILRNFESDMIDSLALQGQADSIQAELNAFTQSINNTTGSFATTGSNTFVGNQNIQGALTASLPQGYVWVGNGGNVSSLVPTSSIKTDVSNLTTTASFNAYTASNDARVQSLEAKTGSYATTGSNNFIGNQTINGSLNITGDITASKLLVQVETASIIYSSGSNQLGDAANDVQTLYGSVRVMNQLTASGLHYPTTDGVAGHQKLILRLHGRDLLCAGDLIVRHQ